MTRVLLFTNDNRADHLGLESGTGTLCDEPLDGWVGRSVPTDPDEIEAEHDGVCGNCLRILRARRA